MELFINLLLAVLPSLLRFLILDQYDHQDQYGNNDSYSHDRKFWRGKVVKPEQKIDDPVRRSPL
jgi:hypothetical protein